MSSLTGSISTTSRDSWQPVTTGNTATPSYWLNWRFLICFIWVLAALIFASTVISKYEGPRGKQRRRGQNQEGREPEGLLYEDEVWKPCVKGVHPGWLLAFRVIAFFVLVVLLLLNVHVDGGAIFYFYTQWTFTLVTIYFGLGSVLSIYGCFQYQDEESGADHRMNSREFDAERGTGVKHMGSNQERSTRRIAGFWAYLFQIIFQMSAGAVMLTDCVFWFIIVPFLTIKDYHLNFLIIYMHSINAVFLLGDTVLNCLRFPWFRIAYFFVWTVVYVLFQWIVHAIVPLWWPYPFLDLSTPLAPLWYSSVALMHIPCYGIFVLIMKLKQFLLSKWFPHSYQCVIMCN